MGGGEERKREGRRIKTNPLCELVLVAMETIITSHLGEHERKGGGGEMGQRGEERWRDEGNCPVLTFRQTGGLMVHRSVFSLMSG